MTADLPHQVLIAAGGLGTRVASWSRYLPKEYYPVDGRPGITHVLDEVAQLGPAHAVIVYHPYYRPFALWAHQTLAGGGDSGYMRAAGFPDDVPATPPGLRVDLIPQHGPYGDLTSVLNAADHFAHARAARPLYVAFSDKLFSTTNPVIALSEAPHPGVAIYAHPYRPEAAGARGVIVTERSGSCRVMTGLVEKPDRAQAQQLEQQHGVNNLFLFEGRARLTTEFIDYARRYHMPGRGHAEPKLALAIGAFARRHAVAVVPGQGQAIDLGQPGDAPRAVPNAATR
jgi:UTP-glucose-1-phosphate uridylyltransferase